MGLLSTFGKESEKRNRFVFEKKCETALFTVSFNQVGGRWEDLEGFGNVRLLGASAY